MVSSVSTLTAYCFAWSVLGLACLSSCSTDSPTEQCLDPPSSCARDDECAPGLACEREGSQPASAGSCGTCVLERAGVDENRRVLIDAFQIPQFLLVPEESPDLARMFDWVRPPGVRSVS